MVTETGGTWIDDIFGVLVSNQIRQVAYVPDAGHADLIRQCEHCGHMLTIPLTTEEEGVALLAGAWLGGERGVLLMQSSGIGNCINMLSLPRVCAMPLLILVTMRGQSGETNPWQIPMGENMPGLLKAVGVQSFQVDQAQSVGPTVEHAVKAAFTDSRIAVVLIAQSLIGIKNFNGE